MAISNNRQIAFAATDGRVFLVTVVDGACYRTPSHLYIEPALLTLSFSADDRLRSLHSSGVVVVADTSSAHTPRLSRCVLPLGNLSPGGGPLLDAGAFVPDADRVILPHHELGRGGLRVISFGAMLRPWEPFPATTAMEVDIARVHKKAAAADCEWEGKASEPLPGGEKYMCMAGSTGKYVCAGTTAGRVRVWDVRTGLHFDLSVGDGRSEVKALCFSKGATLIAAYLQDAALEVWQWESRSKVWRINPFDGMEYKTQGWTSVTYAVAFSPDDNKLAISASTCFLVFDWQELALLMPEAGTGGAVRSLQSHCLVQGTVPSGAISATITSIEFRGFGHVLVCAAGKKASYRVDLDAESATSVTATKYVTPLSPDIYDNTWEIDASGPPRVRVAHPHRPSLVDFYLPGPGFHDVSVEHGIYKVVYRILSGTGGGDGIECYVLNLGTVIPDAERRRLGKRGGGDDEEERPVRRRAITPVPLDGGKDHVEERMEEPVDDSFWLEDDEPDDEEEDWVLEDVE
ncbi:hypothetical protein HK101_008753 [Irineochytrium annulatum]|nr:hypothetical protein HK101_008753 [Irineochytrium annulatum]